VELVKAQPGAPRFLKENPTTKIWEEMSFKDSMAKVQRTFRTFRSKTMSKATSDDEYEVDADDESVLVVLDDESGVDDDDESVVVIVPRPVKTTAQISPSSTAGGSTLICSTAISEPRSIDIVCGRSPCGNSHPGNLAFRECLQACRSSYESAKHFGDKVQIRRQAMQQIQEQPGTPRFLTFNEDGHVWEELSFQRALQEITKTFKDLRRNKQPPTWTRPPATTIQIVADVAIQERAEELQSEDNIERGQVPTGTASAVVPNHPPSRDSVPTTTAERQPMSRLGNIRAWTKEIVGCFGS
jgi:hypothetical protein